MNRALITVGALFGMLGIVLASLSVHVATSYNLLNIASNFLLFHAPVLMLIPVLVRSGLGRTMIAYLGGSLMLVGVCLFSGELVLQELYERSLFYMAAPTGGTMLIVGWLMVALSALFARRHADTAQ